MLGNSAEFFAAEPLSSNGVRAAGQGSCADWTIGEDVVLPADAVPGFRNMADPEEDNDPDDYSERLLGSADRGFVHSNSAISNHAYYLLVNGGVNASCAAPATHNAAHCGPGEPVVTGIGLAAAEQIMFAGITLAASSRSVARSTPSSSTHHSRRRDRPAQVRVVPGPHRTDAGR